ncbi:MAG: hypothetical protein UX38_C0004G0022 [Microgenomates group bacterium GW2011_GWC1_46_16]|uniref:Uncharacterized protein n=2 Tax=Candidatus Collieribacteriota TaxID=1752725 RepID=A0A1F5FZH6_9BACT|nr:MAG: hypothetical protein UX32_C0003G0002 [Microgenomates group bacterium GW2011_GWF1_46_12]KKU26642.1 MAG: hypothetical protein UX38_C0004G0022 [Microgenomates group bacterium GW2011_GWC1_46_16]KKU28103.1 MAG: hypothetical protein UX40_C0003G0050 [Microgenomates group bacterium GW2011_GWF2_46_18]KKU45768.1 MAG: hypothetical protein UX63_C0001G0049 [Microgenomates group bacterium GW2011_GWB1_46_7]KKU60506.1 MAG: hypothetical protein UX82_C0010G0010 [Microgenomates group bacterium GW2011_GWE1
MSEPGGDSKKISRRDFLKLAGAALGGLGLLKGGSELSKLLGKDEGETKESPWTQMHFENNPKELFDHPELRDRMEAELGGWGRLVDELWKVDQRKHDLPEEGFVKLEEWDKSVGKLVEMVFHEGELCWGAEKESLKEVLPEAQTKYYEYASYLRMSLIVADYFRDLNPEKVYEFLVHLPEQELVSLRMGSDPIDVAMPDDFRRLQIGAMWNYPWNSMILGQATSGTHPIVAQIVSETGSELWEKPGWETEDILPDKSMEIDKDPWTLWRRPEKGQIINFDPEVAKAVKKKLSKLGIERGMKSITWMDIGKENFPQGNAEISTSKINVGGGVENLDLKTYEKNALAYDGIIFHEATHSLWHRSWMLKGLDRLAFRDLYLKIARQFDPLRSMKSIFAPEGEYPAVEGELSDVEAKVLASENSNEMIATDYSVGILMGQGYRVTVGQYTKELNMGMREMGNGDLYKDLLAYRNHFGLHDYIDKLQTSLPTLEGLARLTAETIIGNRSEIEYLKRGNLLGHVTNPRFIEEVVLPLTLAHLTMYRPDEVKQAMMEGSNPEVSGAFFDSWNKRLKKFIQGLFYDELVANVVGYMLVDPGDKSKWGEVNANFGKMLNLLKKNGLAYKSEKKTV